jgi:hypothetical protein
MIESASSVVRNTHVGNVEALNSIRLAAAAYPVGFRGNRLNLLLLDEVEPITATSVEYLRSLDNPRLSEERHEYFVDEAGNWPFPCIEVGARPDPREVSVALFDRFDLAKRILPTQRDIAPLVVDRAIANDADIVVLMICDGLSYYDLPDEPSIQPCLVAGVTITESGYREAVGQPSLSQRLFAAGYRRQHALTYFSPDCTPVAQALHSAFGASQVARIATFEEGLAYLDRANITHGYVQFAATGLDGLCHHHRDTPPREKYIEDLLHRFDKLIERLAYRRRRVLACLTADHGILWREHLEGSTEILEDLSGEERRHPRYLPGALLRGYCRVVKSLGQDFSLLRVPYLTRSLRPSEWGVHGGLSAWESLVPLLFRFSTL